MDHLELPFLVIKTCAPQAHWSPFGSAAKLRQRLSDHSKFYRRRPEAKTKSPLTSRTCRYRRRQGWVTVCPRQSAPIRVLRFLRGLVFVRPRQNQKAGAPSLRLPLFVPEVVSDIGTVIAGCVFRFVASGTNVFPDSRPSSGPSRVPPCALVASATGFRAQPMALGSFNSSLRLLPPMAAGHREATQFHLTSYGLRRLAPTLASSAGLLLHQRLPFGNWEGGCLSSTE